ncbi:alanine dehydrogenase [Aerococcaceae bacterium DSM 111020]|nr:alanine dehydrogenase [Aerococcaceae bacterium DSM 111020]
MKIGVPKEIKPFEGRVGLTPANVRSIADAGHTIVIEKGAGLGSSFDDQMYIEAGATIVDTASEAWDSEMVIKVKEPLEEEFDYFKENQILFAYLHLAPEDALTKALLDKNVTAVAYETMVLDGKLPLLQPMSHIAGRMSIQVAAHLLEKQNGGRGILLGGIPGVANGEVVIIGGGAVGYHAAQMAMGLGAHVTILDLNPNRLQELSDLLGEQAVTLMSNADNIAYSVSKADVVVGSVLIPGAKAPVLVTEEMIENMPEGSVIIDIAVDQGGNFETSHPTTHDDPTFIKHGVVHYCVANMPGAVPQTATVGLTNVTSHYAQQIADKGIVEAAQNNETIFTGINTYQGKLTEEHVAEAQGLEYTDLHEILG